MDNNTERRNAGDLVNIIRDIINQEIDKRDSTAICIVESVNENGSLNLFVLPDRQNIIRNITNQCKFNFKAGDTALLYKIENRLSNSFVIAKYNVTENNSGVDNFLSQNSINPVQNQIITEALNGLSEKIDDFSGSAQGEGGTMEINSSSWDTTGTYPVFVKDFPELTGNDLIQFKPATRTDETILESSAIFVTINGNTVMFEALTAPTENINLDYFITRGTE